jgi:calcineurin-like phosphoesterase family protein
MKFSPATRPYNDVTEMREAIIREWNNTVKPDDTVYDLGDFCFGGSNYRNEIIARLNGTIIRVRGNHDPKGFGVDYLETSINGQHIVMSHYPFACWNKGHHGSWMLHGHSHGSYRGVGKILDVGWDAVGARIISFAEVKAIMDKKEQVTLDGH